MYFAKVYVNTGRHHQVTRPSMLFLIPVPRPVHRTIFNLSNGMPVSMGNLSVIIPESKPNDWYHYWNVYHYEKTSFGQIAFSNSIQLELFSTLINNRCLIFRRDSVVDSKILDVGFIFIFQPRIDMSSMFLSVTIYVYPKARGKSKLKHSIDRMNMNTTKRWTQLTRNLIIVVRRACFRSYLN